MRADGTQSSVWVAEGARESRKKQVSRDAKIGVINHGAQIPRKVAEIFPNQGGTADIKIRP